MFPSDRQLLKQLRKSVDQLQRQNPAPEQQAQLGAMDVVLNELLLRQDTDFYVDHFRAGRDLLTEFRALFEGTMNSGTPSFSELPSMLDARWGSRAMAAALLKLSAALESCVEGLPAASLDSASSLLERVADWDTALMQHRTQRVPMDREALARQSLSIDAERLQRYLRHRRPEWSNTVVTRCHRVAGGFSKCTLLFDIEDAAQGRQELALRAEQPIHMMDMDGSNVANEFPVVRQAFDSGIPVPEPLLLEPDPQHLGGRFIIFRKAEGTNFGTAKGAAQTLSSAVVEDLARVMARIHNIKMDRGAPWVTSSHFAKWLDFGNARANTLARLAEWRAQGKAARIFPAPQIARTLRWLEANVPDDDGEPVFLHGDFGPHNILLDGDRVAAVLDWEISTPGDPAYDITWFLNCTAGAVDRDMFLDRYYAAGGQRVSDYKLRYFEVFACMFMPMVCNSGLRLIEDEDGADINLAVFGTQFPYEYARRLQDAIDRAESVRKR